MNLNSDRLTGPLPKVCVLLATYNGERWVEEQLRSILSQAGVEVTVYAADDCSTDATASLLRQFAAEHPNVHVLKPAPRRGSAVLNFYYLLKVVQFDAFDYVAFADQDDIWCDGRLRRQVQVLRKSGAKAVSSDVVAFWPNGRRKLIKKSQPMVAEDHLFEAAGPGCTYLMTRGLILSFAQALRRPEATVTGLANHDWMVYAWARCQGMRWVISPEPTVLYRQHGGNELGANVGPRAARSRLARARSGWYRRAVLEVAQFCGCSGEKAIRRVADGHIQARVHLALTTRRYRRRWQDAWALSLLLLLGYF
jgi:rhamnosyltransferase